MFRKTVLKHVVDINERYIVAGATAESALMFLPSEAVYAELHANFTDVVQSSYRARVWIVSPTTLMATLNTVRAVLKDAQMREQAHLIQDEVRKMLDDVGRLSQRADNLQKHFAQAQNDVSQIITSSTKIGNRAEKIDDMRLEDDDASKARKPVATSASRVAAPFKRRRQRRRVISAGTDAKALTLSVSEGAPPPSASLTPPP